MNSQKAKTGGSCKIFIQVHKELKKKPGKKHVEWRSLRLWVSRLLNQTGTGAGKSGTDQGEVLLIKHDSTSSNKDRKCTKHPLWQILRKRKKRRSTEKQSSDPLLCQNTHQVYCYRAVNDKPVEGGRQICSLVDTSHNTDQHFSWTVHCRIGILWQTKGVDSSFLWSVFLWMKVYPLCGILLPWLPFQISV